MTINLRRLSIILLAIIAGFKLYLIYWQFSFHGLLVPPSPDLVAHLDMIDRVTNVIKSHNLSFSDLTGYPPLFKLIIAYTAVIFSKDSLEILKMIAPYWLIVVIPPFYLLVKKLYNWQIAFWATAVFIIVSSNPLLNFGDAQYPDILGYNLIAPFYLIAFVNLLKNTDKLRNYILYLITLFLLFVSHHMVFALMLAVSAITLMTYIYYCRNEVGKIFNIKMTFFLIILFGMIYSLQKIFGLGYVGSMLKSVIALKPPINDVTAVVLDYSQIGSLLTPFLEFIGFAGLMLCIVNIWAVKDDENRFANVLLVVWVILLWLLSRSSIFGLPQRILREISLPLSICSGVLIYEVINRLKTNIQQIIVGGLFGYLMIANFSQLSQPPFLLPDGFKDSVWYREVDEQKFNYFKKNITKDNVILTNYSNPVLLYMLEKEGYRIIRLTDFVPKDILKDNREAYINDYINNLSANILFINNKPSNVNSDVYFYQYADYNLTRDEFGKYEYADKQLKKVFRDDSRIITLDHRKSKKK